jgi:hypothetical protein
MSSAYFDLIWIVFIGFLEAGLVLADFLDVTDLPDAGTETGATPPW